MENKDLFEVVNTRRSCRSYRNDPVPKEVLEQIVEAGRMAPSGNDNQTCHLIVVQSAEKLLGLRDTLTATMANTPVKEGMPPPMVALICKAKEGPVEVNYGAPVLILVANKKGYGNAIADSSCALENMMLAATALGVGNCWINLYHLLRSAPPMQSYFQSLGMKDDEEVCGALALGYSDHLETTPLPRKGNLVTYV